MRRRTAAGPRAAAGERRRRRRSRSAPSAAPAAARALRPRRTASRASARTTPERTVRPGRSATAVRRRPGSPISTRSRAGPWSSRRGRRARAAARQLRREARQPRPRGARHPGAARHAGASRSTTGASQKLFTQRAGGLTVYQFDPDRDLLLLLRAPRRATPPGLAEGTDACARARSIGYVGTTATRRRDAAPALHDLQAGRGQALVAGHADQPVPAMGRLLVARRRAAVLAAAPRPRRRKIPFARDGRAA